MAAEKKKTLHKVSRRAASAPGQCRAEQRSRKYTTSQLTVDNCDVIDVIHPAGLVSIYGCRSLRGNIEETAESRHASRCILMARDRRKNTYIKSKCSYDISGQFQVDGRLSYAIVYRPRINRARELVVIVIDCFSEAQAALPQHCRV